MDNRFMPARMNLAHLPDPTGEIRAAKSQLRETIRFNPEFGDAYFSLGLLWAGESRMDSAAAYLEKAVRLLPEKPRVHYNYALALQSLGRAGRAEKEFLRTVRIQGESGEQLYALALLYVQGGPWEEAGTLVGRLAAADPGHAGLADLAKALRARPAPQAGRPAPR